MLCFSCVFCTVPVDQRKRLRFLLFKGICARFSHAFLEHYHKPSGNSRYKICEFEGHTLFFLCLLICCAGQITSPEC